jgi:hypothetical protein
MKAGLAMIRLSCLALVNNKVLAGITGKHFLI